MNIGDWFTLGAVIIALFFGVWSIIHSNLIQKKQLRHSLLRELIEWCVQIIEAVRLEEIPIVGTQDLETARRRVFGNKSFKLLALDSKPEYMYQISRISPDLRQKVEELQRKYKEIYELTWNNISSKEYDYEKISDTHFRELSNIASGIIVLATQIHTKNLLQMIMSVSNLLAKAEKPPNLEQPFEGFFYEFSFKMAEGVGFEPTVPLREQRFSRPSP